MAKKQSSKRRTQVKDLPKKGKKLSKDDMKKVKGGLTGISDDAGQMVVFQRSQKTKI